MDKKLSFYLNNSNFKETAKTDKRPKEIRRSQHEERNLLKIVDGKISIDDNDMNLQLRKSEDMEVYEETGHVTSMTHLIRKRNISRWSKIETEYFYEALSLCGLDFSLIAELFKNKDRKSCKLKYHNELKRNNGKVVFALNNHVIFCRTKFELLKCKIDKSIQK